MLGTRAQECALFLIYALFLFIFQAPPIPPFFVQFFEIGNEKYGPGNFSTSLLLNLMYNGLMSKKEKVAPPVPPTPEEIQNQSLDIDSASLEEKAKTTFKPEFVRALKKIAYYTARVGLPLEEACLLVDVDYEKFQEEMKLEPLVKKIIQLKELEYKKDLLATLSQKARSGDDKLAQWLLARRYPDEYGEKKKGSGEESSQDFLFEAMQFIRKNGDNRPLVNEVSGRSLIVKRETASGGTIETRINQILSPNQHE